jgi:hypothetical protein
MDAAVHAHAAEGIINMRGVAGQKDASPPKGFGDPLVHLVKRGVRDLII